MRYARQLFIIADLLIEAVLWLKDPLVRVWRTLATPELKTYDNASHSDGTEVPRISKVPQCYILNVRLGEGY